MPGPFYGATKSEAVLGRALFALFESGRAQRQQVILATKVGRYGDRDFDFSAARVERSVEESLRRLRTGYIDLLIAHDVEFGDLDAVIRETLPAMRKLKRQGKVHAACCSSALRARVTFMNSVRRCASLASAGCRCTSSST